MPTRTKPECDPFAGTRTTDRAYLLDVNRRLDSTERRDDTLATKIDNLSKPQWAIWFGGASLVVSVLAAFALIITQWITLRVDPLKEFQVFYAQQIEKQFELTRRDRRDIEDEIEKEVDLARENIRELRQSVFPLEVHKRQWEHYDQGIAAANDRIREINDKISGLYDPADKFKELQQQVDNLRASLLQILRDGNGKTATPDIPTQ